MRLDAVRIKNLHDPTKVDALNEIIDVRIPYVVAKDEKCLLNSFGLRQRNDQVSQVGQSLVDLNDDDWRIGCQWTKRFLVVNLLFGVYPIDVTTDILDLEIRQCTGRPVG